ncbi:hypothetical protein [Bauldia litoralis]|uniref:hypothetical protein n=1 Tax=Bauldia litoralis TaxID=665467 RepID=UPI0032640709
MDRQLILAAIDQAIARGVSSVEERNDPDSGHKFGAQVRSLTTVRAEPEVVAIVMDALLGQPEFHWLIGRTPSPDDCAFYIPGPGGGGVGILPIKVANWLLAKAISLPGGPDEALSSLEAFLGSSAVTGMRVAAIWGVVVEEPAEIEQDIWLAPLDYLPPSIGRDHLDEMLPPHLPQSQYRPAISCIVQVFEMDPAVRPSGERAPAWYSEHVAAFERLEELGYATVLSPGAMPQVISRWVQTAAVDSVPGLTGGSGGEFEMLEVVPNRRMKLKPLPAADTARRMSAYATLPAAVKKDLSVALRRLSMARARRRIEDRSIELRIALEALFGGQTNMEISHKVAARAALLTSEPARRRRSYEVLKRAYDIGSGAVHGGLVKSSGKKIAGAAMSGEQVLQEADECLRVALNLVVERGGLPDWTNVDLALDVRAPPDEDATAKNT